MTTGDQVEFRVPRVVFNPCRNRLRLPSGRQRRSGGALACRHPIGDAAAGAAEIEAENEARGRAELLADISMGKITHWNDPKLVELNNGVKLPNLAIAPDHDGWRRFTRAEECLVRDDLEPRRSPRLRRVRADRQLHNFPGEALRHSETAPLRNYLALGDQAA